MAKSLFQLKGVYGYNIALYLVPSGLDVQEVFNEAFDNVNQEDMDLDEVDDYLEEKYKIERTFVEEIHTNKL